MALGLGFFHHSSVELKPRQLAVEEPARPKGGDARGQFEPLDLLWQTHR